VEAYVYSLRDKLEGQYTEYISPEDKEVLTGRLTEAEVRLLSTLVAR
jgi:hypothetical protein